MRNAHCRTWNMARKLKIKENEIYTLQDVKYGEENLKDGKVRNVHCRTWKMARKPKIMENENHPLNDLKNEEITIKHEK